MHFLLVINNLFNLFKIKHQLPSERLANSSCLNARCNPSLLVKGFSQLDRNLGKKRLSSFELQNIFPSRVKTRRGFYSKSHLPTLPKKLRGMSFEIRTVISVDDLLSKLHSHEFILGASLRTLPVISDCKRT